MANPAPETKLRTGFIGLGQQGGPIAARMLGGGFPLSVWARRPEVLDPYVEKGAVPAASISDLAVRCDYVALCVVDDAGIAEVCDQLIPTMSAGSLLVIHSTVLPESCETLARRCAERGIGFLDAPVSGGGTVAAAGKLTVMCGGTEEDFTRARAVLETFSGMLVRLGPAGSAQRAKIINNALLTAHMGLAQAALQAGEALGVDRAALAELIQHSSGRSYGFEVYARLATPAAFAHGAPLLMKDVNLLSTILPDDHGAALLRKAADEFLSAVTTG